MRKQHTIIKSTLLASILIAGCSWAHQPGDIIIRAGLTTVVANDESGHVNVNGVGDVGMAVEVNNNTQLGLNFVYLFDSHYAIEVLAATPFSHDITLTNTSDNALELGDAKLANTKQLPPTISVLYYFNSAGAVQPYIGAGLNYTVFFDEQFVSDREAQSFTELKLDDSFGVAVQAGFDYSINDNMLVNASLRYIDIDTEANFGVLDTTAKVSTEIDPWVFSLMLGYKF